MHRPLSFILFVWLTAAAVGSAREPELRKTPWDVQRLSRAPEFQWINQQGNVHSLKYAGEKFQGRPTRAFAYYASPATLGAEKTKTKFPGIVLVHGGGGTAFSEWAEIWAKRGYAAVAMDLAGRGEGRKPLEDGGPDQTAAAKFDLIDGPLQDQWPYHAVANVILAHSLLRSFDEVNVERTALTGISWGGYLTCITAGLDQRFKMAMPVYGCGYLRDNGAWVVSQFDKMKPGQAEKWHSLWDPSQYIGSATMPVVFVNGTNDFAYPMDSYAKTCALVRGEKNYSIQLRMRHGHIFDFPEFFLFVDQYLQGGTPMPVVQRPVVKDGRVSAAVKSETKLVSARLHYSLGPHRENKTRDWTTKPLIISGNQIHGEAPPKNAAVWYIDVTDERKALVSSEVIIPVE